MIESTENKLSYIVGESKVFPFNIRFFRPEDIKCFLNQDNIQTELVRNVDFSIERKANYNNGAKITLLAKKLPVGATLSILRICDITQDLALPESGKLPSAGLEKQLDKLTMIAQQLSEEIDRSIKVGVGETDVNPDALLAGIYEAADTSQKAAEAAQQKANEAADAAAFAGAAAEEANRAKESAEGSVEAVREAADEAYKNFDELLEKTGGLPIGSIFPFPASIPPEGAYLLNGQTIANCETLYPKFWQWLTKNAGEMVETPVYKDWTMPALTADGYMGAGQYAVKASGTVVSGYEAYKSFDGSHGGAKSFACIDNAKSGHLIWYSPVPLKITGLLFHNATAVTASELITTFKLYFSNNGTTWIRFYEGTLYSTAADEIQKVNIRDTVYNSEYPAWHYYKIEGVNGGGEDLEFPEITLYGEEYLYTNLSGNGNILTMSWGDYEYTRARTGVCGGFVIDSQAGSVRVPTLVNGTLWGADSSNIGQSLAAGLPNIEGEYIHSSAYNLSSITGAFSREDYASSLSGDSSGGSTDNKIIFDASKSNPIYGNSDTVQPPAIRVSWCIQIFNAATALSEQESAELASLMQTKAQTDFANVNGNLDFVVESWDDGNGNWYRKYRSGWVEQGGVGVGGTTTKGDTFTLFVEYSDANYNLTASINRDVTALKNGCPLVVVCFNKTSTTFNASTMYGGNSFAFEPYHFSWIAKGKAAN